MRAATLAVRGVIRRTATWSSALACLPSTSGSSGSSEHGDGRRYRRTILLAAPMVWTTFKVAAGIEEFKYDDDPVINLIKRARFERSEGKYDLAIATLGEAMLMVTRDDYAPPAKTDREVVVSKLQFELGDTFIDAGRLDDAERILSKHIERLGKIHNKSGSSPEFIKVSLLICDVLQKKGEDKAAESGYEHCLTTQAEVCRKHDAHTTAWNRAYVDKDGQHESYSGSLYTDPKALMSMCTEDYALYLMSRNRSWDVVLALVDQTLQLANELYGPQHIHTIGRMNNFAVKMLNKMRFVEAEFYLSEVVRRAAKNAECAALMPGYLCNHAEALFHLGETERALQQVETAEKTAQRLGDEVLVKHVALFKRDLQREPTVRGKKRFYFW